MCRPQFIVELNALRDYFMSEIKHCKKEAAKGITEQKVIYNAFLIGIVEYDFLFKRNM